MKLVRTIIVVATLAGAAAVQAGERRAIYLNEAEMNAPWHAGWSDALVSGDLVFISGIVISPGPGEADLEPAFERGFAQLRRSLKAVGSGLDDVLDYTVFLTDIDAQLPVLDRVRLRHTRPPYAASTVVQVSRLVAPEAIAEVRVVARAAKSEDR